MFVSDVVDQQVFERLISAGLKIKPTKRRQRESDALHLMYAVHQRSDWFVTLDPDFLDKRSVLEPLCRGVRIVTPVELETLLSGQDC